MDDRAIEEQERARDWVRSRISQDGFAARIADETGINKAWIRGWSAGRLIGDGSYPKVRTVILWIAQQSE